MKGIYDLAWFKQRAYDGLKKISEGTWDYSDSLLLYLPGFDEIYEDIQNNENPYYQLVTAPERHYLQEIAPAILKELPEGFDYIDLGPGTEHKEQFIFDAAKSLSKTFIYHPVDISERYLESVTDYASCQGIFATPLRVSFEDVSSELVSDSNTRFVSLGLTYGNYAPDEAFKLLKEIAGEGKIFINPQIRERTNMESLLPVYNKIAIEISAPKLKLIDIDLHKDLSDIEVTDEIKVWATITNSNSILEKKGIKVGDKILFFQSIRPSLATLEQDLSKHFSKYKILDTGRSFVGVLAN